MQNQIKDLIYKTMNYNNHNDSISVDEGFDTIYIGRVEEQIDGLYVPFNTLDVPLSKTNRTKTQAETIVFNNHLNPCI